MKPYVTFKPRPGTTNYKYYTIYSIMDGEPNESLSGRLTDS
jgi:hypothetical protein